MDIAVVHAGLPKLCVAVAATATARVLVDKFLSTRDRTFSSISGVRTVRLRPASNLWSTDPVSLRRWNTWTIVLWRGMYRPGKRFWSLLLHARDIGSLHTHSNYVSILASKVSLHVAFGQKGNKIRNKILYSLDDDFSLYVFDYSKEIQSTIFGVLLFF